MGLLGNLFNDIVDIAFAPLKIGAKIIDITIDADSTDVIDEIKDSIKIEKE